MKYEEIFDNAQDALNVYMSFGNSTLKNFLKWLQLDIPNWVTENTWVVVGTRPYKIRSIGAYNINFTDNSYEPICGVITGRVGLAVLRPWTQAEALEYFQQFPRIRHNNELLDILTMTSFKDGTFQFNLEHNSVSGTKLLVDDYETQHRFPCGAVVSDIRTH